MADKKDKIKRFFPSLYKPFTNQNIKALLEAIGQEDNKIVEQIENAKEQLFVSTAVGEYLDALGSNYGIQRPITTTSFTIDDELFREIIKILSFKPKQIKKTMEELLLAFFGENEDIFVQEINPNEIIIQLPETLVNAREALLGSTHIKQHEGEILNVDNVTKKVLVNLDFFEGTDIIENFERLTDFQFGSSGNSFWVFNSTFENTSTISSGPNVWTNFNMNEQIINFPYSGSHDMEFTYRLRGDIAPGDVRIRFVIDEGDPSEQIVEDPTLLSVTSDPLILEQDTYSTTISLTTGNHTFLPQARLVSDPYVQSTEFVTPTTLGDNVREQLGPIQNLNVTSTGTYNLNVSYFIRNATTSTPTEMIGEIVIDEGTVDEQIFSNVTTLSVSQGPFEDRQFLYTDVHTVTLSSGNHTFKAYITSTNPSVGYQFYLQNQDRSFIPAYDDRWQINLNDLSDNYYYGTTYLASSDVQYTNTGIWNNHFSSSQTINIPTTGDYRMFHKAFIQKGSSLPVEVAWRMIIDEGTLDEQIINPPNIILSDTTTFEVKQADHTETGVTLTAGNHTFKYQTQLVAGPNYRSFRDYPFQLRIDNYGVDSLPSNGEILMNTGDEWDLSLTKDLGPLPNSLSTPRKWAEGNISVLTNKGSGLSTESLMYREYTYPLDLTEYKYLKLNVFLQDTSIITKASIGLFTGSDGSVYEESTYLRDGWNQITIDLNSPDTTIGSGATLSSIDKIEYKITAGDANDTIIGIKYDNLYGVKSDTLYEANYFANWKFSQQDQVFDVISSEDKRTHMELTLDPSSNLTNIDVQNRFFLLDETFVGDFVFDPNGSYTITKTRSFLNDTINSGDPGAVINVDDATVFPDSPGNLVFNFGKDNEEALVPYLGLDSPTSLLLDPNYTFTNDHLDNSIINLVIPGGYEPKDDGTDHGVYTVGTEEATIIVQSLLEKLKAAGVVLKFIIKRL